MFEEEELQCNPDDDQAMLPICTTPKRPASRSRKRVRSEASPEAVIKNCTKKRKALNKKERLQVIKHIKSTSVLPVLKGMFKEKERGTFSKLLDNEETLRALIKFHQETFVLLYEANGIGKDKYISFQLQWHKYCSIFLLPKASAIQCVFSPPTKGMEDVRHIWLAFCEKDTDLESNTAEQNKFMMMFSSSIYEILLREVHAYVMKFNDCTGSSTNVAIDQDDVYFRFGGATLASMLHKRYDDIRKCNADKREGVSLEIKVLQAINTKNKESMPSYLQYRDRGYMYTPDPLFVPLFRAIDECIKGVVNEQGIKEHGDQLIKVTHVLASETTHLQSTFIQILEKKMTIENDIEKQAAFNVYDDMLRKLCNIRIQEFLSSLQQKMVSGKGQASLTGQNLRDQLLTQHLNVHSKVNLN